MWDLRDPKDFRIVVGILQVLRQWDNSELAVASNLSRNTIAAYLEGTSAPSRRNLERIAGAVDFPLELLDSLISLVRVLRLAAEEAAARPRRSPKSPWAAGFLSPHEGVSGEE